MGGELVAQLMLDLQVQQRTVVVPVVVLLVVDLGRRSQLVALVVEEEEEVEQCHMWVEGRVSTSKRRRINTLGLEVILM